MYFDGVIDEYLFLITALEAEMQPEEMLFEWRA